jgi:hypothetical protein
MATPVKKIAERKKLPVYCNQCVGGPDLMRVEIEDGVATRIESNYDIANEHPGGGRVCVKAYGLIQKTYNPNRIKQPMKRTNPKKGREHDPGFAPICSPCRGCCARCSRAGAPGSASFAASPPACWRRPAGPWYPVRGRRSSSSCRPSATW